MANKGVFRYLRDGSNNDLNALAKTTTFASEVFDAKDFDKFGILIDVNTVAGTSPSVTPAVQVTYEADATTPTWLAALSGAENSQTFTSFAAITDAREKMYVWPQWFPESAKGSLNVKYRVNFTFTANTTSWTTNVWLVMRNFSRGG